MSDPIYEAQAYEIAKMARSISALEAENAKLREFAKNAYRHICTQDGYLRGSGYDSFDYFDTVARELRIEVEHD